MQGQARQGASLTVKSQYNEEMHKIKPPVDKEKLTIHLSSDSE